jgi:hypothetical protein
MHRKQTLFISKRNPNYHIEDIGVWAAPHIPQVLIVGPGDRVYHLEKL